MPQAKDGWVRVLHVRHGRGGHNKTATHWGGIRDTGAIGRAVIGQLERRWALMGTLDDEVKAIFVILSVLVLRRYRTLDVLFVDGGEEGGERKSLRLGWQMNFADDDEAIRW